MISHMYLMWSAGHPDICGFNDNAQNSNQWTCDLPSSYSETFAILFSLDSQSQSSHSVISFINGFIIGILMLNILIAIVSNFFILSLEKGDHTFWRNRLQLISECQSLFSMFSFIHVCHDDFRREIESDSHNYNDDEFDNYVSGDDFSRVEGDDELRIAFDCNEDRQDVGDIDGEDLISSNTEKSAPLEVRVDRIRFGKESWNIYKQLGKADKKVFFRWVSIIDLGNLVWSSKSLYFLTTISLFGRPSYLSSSTLSSVVQSMA
jgi:hypothetical protein